MILKIKGDLFAFGVPYELTKNRMCQRIILKVNHSDVRIKTDYFAVFIYGADIDLFWKSQSDAAIDKAGNSADVSGYTVVPTVLTITAKLNGRMLKDRNTLTLSYKSVLWHYL